MSAPGGAVVSRLLAFLAVGCAVGAVAWTIRDPLLLTVGVLGLAAGHFYSWRRRHASIRRSLILLLFMVLTAYLGGDILLSGLSDRLLLSRYLIYGLVIGSFDMMRPRNVLASLVLGGLLLVLVSELALNFWFLLFPSGFIVLAIASAVVSRIETETARAVVVGELKWRPLIRLSFGFTLAAVLISTSFFLLMPRLVSSQVAQASWLPSRIDLSLGSLSILPSRPGASVAPEILPSLLDRPPGAAGDYAALGYIGSLADKPVMHVRSRVSSYWRGLTLDVYDGRGWLSSSSITRLREVGRGEYVLPDSRLRSSGERTYWQTYFLLADQPNAIFTGYWPGRIYLPEEMQAFLEKGTLYRTLSLTPNLRPERLRRDRAVSLDVAATTLPPITARTAALADSIVLDAPTDYDKAVRLEQFLLAGYPYDLGVGPLPDDRDAVDYFLFEQQAGYCSQFATAMAVMARHTGLPARVAAGYLPGYIDPLTGAHIVRVGDAHAWVEIYFQRHGWVAFDPTPRPDAAMGFASGRNWVYFGLEEFTGVSLSTMLSPLSAGFSLGTLSLPRWIWIVLLLVSIIVIAVLLSVRRRRVRAEPVFQGYSSLEGPSRQAMLNLYRRALSLLHRRGLPSRRSHQALFEYAAATEPDLVAGGETLEWLTAAASRAAYSPLPFPPSTVTEARRKVSALRHELARRR